MTRQETFPNGISRTFAKTLTEEKIEFVARMGLVAELLAPGHVRLRAPLDGNQNHLGTMYAGALFTLAEIPGGALAITSFDVARFYPIVKSMTVDFLRPATTDITVELTITADEIARIETEANTAGKSTFLLRAELKDTTGQVVMTSLGDYQLRTWAKP